MRTDRILYGAAYYDEYMPESRIDADMRLMKDAGMNVIRIGESTWSTWEPQDGVFDFTKLKNMLDGAEKYGISVIVGTPTYAIPAWLAKKYPDVLAETHGGQNRYGPRQNMDITHPGYRFHCERIIRKMMEVVMPYPNVIGFQLDNETKPYDTCSPRAQAMFKEHLKKKFGTVEEMNKAYGFAYWSNSIHDWEDLPDVRETINGSFAAEFEAFQRDLVTEFHGWQRAIVDEYRRPDQFVTHNFDYAWEPFRSCGLQPDADQFAAAAHMTVAGCDIYHPSGPDLTGQEISFGGDLARGLKKDNYLVLETQAQGPFNNFPYPGQLRLQAFSHLASGANMVEYWHWHSIHNAIESHWKGVLSHDLQPNESYRETATVGADLERIGSHLVNLKRESPVAIVVSNRSLTAVKHDASFSGLTYNEELFHRMYRALYERNIPCDILFDRERDFSRYQLVITPYLYSAEDGLIDALRDYVEQGGSLLATYRSFFTDQHAAVRHEAQPYRMTDVFGVTYDQFCNGKTVPDVEGFMELLRPAAGTEVLKGCDHYAFRQYAAVTLNRFGSGHAAYIGAKLTYSALEAALDGLLPRLGVTLPAQRWPLVIKEGVNDFGKRVCYLLNYSDAPLASPAPFGGTDLLTGGGFAEHDTVHIPAWGTVILEEQ